MNNNNFVLSVDIETISEQMNELSNNLFHDKDDDYLLNSNLWTDEEHVVANACLALEDAHHLGLDTIVFSGEEGVTECWAMRKDSNAKRGEDTKLVFAPKIQEVLFLCTEKTS